MSNTPPLATSGRPRWSPATKLMVVILIILGAVVLLQRIENIIAPLILAGILAFILNPVVSFFNRWAHIPRSLVLLIIFLIFIGLLTLAIATLTQPLIRQIQNLMGELPGMLESIEGWLARKWTLGPFSYDSSGLLDEAETLLLQEGEVESATEKVTPSEMSTIARE